MPISSFASNITAMTFLSREQAIIVGLEDGGCFIVDLTQEKNASEQKFWNLTEASKNYIASKSSITTISATPMMTKTSGEKACPTIVSVGDAQGTVKIFGVKRSTQKQEPGLKITKTVGLNGSSSIQVLASLSRENIALINNDGLILCQGKDITKLSSEHPIALLPIIGNEKEVLSVYADGTAKVFKIKNKKPISELRLEFNINAIKGIVTGSGSKISYTLVVLTPDKKLLLFVNNQVTRHLADNVLKMELDVCNDTITLAYITTGNEIFCGQINQAGPNSEFTKIGPCDPNSILAVDAQKSLVYVATKNQIDCMSMHGTHYAQIQPNIPTNQPPGLPVGDLIDFSNLQPPPLLRQYAATAPQPQQQSSSSYMPPPPLPQSAYVSNNYVPIPTSYRTPTQIRVPRIVESSTGAKFLMFSKDPIAPTGASKAKLVLCQKLRDDNGIEKLVVVKKFEDEAEFRKELGVSDDRMQTMVGAIRSYGWAEVFGRKNGIETGQKKYYLFIEYMRQGNGLHLRDLLNNNNIDITTRCSILQPFAYDLLSGLQNRFHNQSKYHLDIKPENFMLNFKIANNSQQYTTYDLINGKLEAKLVDFGESIVAPDGKINYGQGDSRYMSPQRLALYRYLRACGTSPQEEDVFRNYYWGVTEDAWALGVTLLELLLGHNPFVYDVYPGRENYAGMNQQILTICNHAFFNKKIMELKTQYPWLNNPEANGLTGAHAAFIKLINGLISVDENKRMETLSQVQQQLK